MCERRAAAVKEGRTESLIVNAHSKDFVEGYFLTHFDSSNQARLKDKLAESLACTFESIMKNVFSRVLNFLCLNFPSLCLHFRK